MELLKINKCTLKSNLWYINYWCCVIELGQTLRVHLQSQYLEGTQVRINFREPQMGPNFLAALTWLMAQKVLGVEQPSILFNIILGQGPGTLPP